MVRYLKQILVVFLALFLCTSCNGLASLPNNPWKVLNLSTEANILDLAFTGDSQHGWAVGSDSAFFESTDGGESWEPRNLELGEQKYRLNSVSFSGDEGWIVGEPAILLHTDDGGKSWSRISLSNKLPGAPNRVLALGSDSAEMSTTVGAIYRTSDEGKTWKALVAEAVGVVRNISRSPSGEYVAVSAKGNFYSTWIPGQKAWTPHNRNSSRRVENMGFTTDGRLWMLARGGQLQFSVPGEDENWEKAQYPEVSTSWGLLDLAYRSPDEVWLAGGSANLLCSFDGGKTWKKDTAVQDVASNFYKVTFLSPERGFVLGQRGVILKYNPAAAQA
ncbi:photosynthesis system II assembly factor Ycf48 [Merismopedia glauca]|uniref:Photosystem II assembly protein Ycf48 n=1 Tax=Merismopedia glauca CCAP 1448/3 TaxID=1296344 RepID=A0A2T1C9S7_9CYAN|nr:photosynthesis system II assembly factor Ycf48 [Merismopedia glauca]PSB05020.1 photosystem II assembly protein [Merismopedia glauca CCAP 1448/3]